MMKMLLSKRFLLTIHQEKKISSRIYSSKKGYLKEIKKNFLRK